MLETKSLIMFDVLADELHFARAANRLNIAQSVLSMGIRRLEDELGTPLFDRGGRAAVRLTRAGATFLPEARAALARVDQAARLGRLAGRGEIGPLTLGYVFSAAVNGLLPALLRILRSETPSLSVSPVQLESPEQLAGIVDGRLDFGLVRPRAVYPPSIAAAIIHEEPLTLILSDQHALASKSTIHPADLADAHFIMPHFRDASGLTDHLHTLAANGNFVLRDYEPTNDFVTALAMAGGGYGVVLAPKSFGTLGMPGLVARQIVRHDDRISLALAWREEPGDPLCERVRALFLDRFLT